MWTAPTAKCGTARSLAGSDVDSSPRRYSRACMDGKDVARKSYCQGCILCALGTTSEGESGQMVLAGSIGPDKSVKILRRNFVYLSLRSCSSCIALIGPSHCNQPKDRRSQSCANNDSHSRHCHSYNQTFCGLAQVLTSQVCRQARIYRTMHMYVGVHMTKW